MSEQRECNELIDALAEKARILQIGRPLPAEGELSDQQIDGVREDLSRFLEERGVTAKKLAAATGEQVTAYTLQHYADRLTDAEQDQSIARQVNRLLEALARREAVRKPSGFVETRQAVRIINVVRMASEMPCIALVLGAAGGGKTTALQAAKELVTGALYVSVTKTGTTPSTII